MSRDRAGFTLIELLVAMVIGGVVVGVLYQVLAGQGRYVQLQGGREEVQQNTRAALELIGSELRTLPGGASLVRADADSVTLRSPRIWGSVCEVTGATTLAMAVPAIAGASFATNSGTGIVVNLGTAAAPVWSNTVGVTSISAPSNSCAGSLLPAGVEMRSVSLSSMPQNGSVTPTRGHILYLYDQITYRTGTSSTVPGLWIQRRIGEGGPSTNQPMAGPVRGGGTGLRFSYFAEGSTLPLPTPILDSAARESVTRVMVTVDAISRHSDAELQQSKADTVMVSLRNRGV